MKARTTVILALIAVGLLFYLFKFESARPTTDEMKTAEAKAFGGRDFSVTDADGRRKGLSDLVTRIELRHGDKVVGLQREKKDDAKAWRITAPIDRRADDAEVSSLLSELEFLKRDQTVQPAKDKPLDLAAYGLDKPEHVVTFWIDDKSWTLRLGNKVSLGNKVYVKRDDENLAVVAADSVLDKAGKGLNDFRDKVALRADKEKATSLALKAADQPEIDCRREKAGWQLLAPVRDLGSAEDIEKLIDNLRDVRVDPKDFLTDDDSKLADYGLDKPSFSLTVREGDAGRTLLFGARSKDKEKLFAKRAGESSVFLLKAADLDKVRKSVKDLRSRKAMPFAVEDVTRLEMTLGGEQVLAVKKDDAWKIEKPETLDADKTQVENYLRELRDLSVEDWNDAEKPDLKACGLDKPVASLNVGLKGAAGAVSLLVGGKREEEKGLYVRRGDQGPILVVDEKFEARASSGYLALLPRKVLSFAKADADRIEIRRADQSVIAKKEGEKWQLLKPVRFEADQNAVNDVLWDLSWMEAKDLVVRKPKDLAPYGLDKPALRVAVQCQETIKKEEPKGKAPAKEEKKEEPAKKTVTYVLLVGKAKDKDLSYAMIEGKDIVFLVDQNVLKRLNAEFARRRVLDVKSDDVLAVTLHYAAPVQKSVRFERDGEKWKMTEPEKRTASRDLVNDIVNSMADLTCTSIAEYEPKDLAKYGLAAPDLRVVADLKDNKKAEIAVGKLEGDKRYVKGSESAFVYVVSQSDAARLEKEKPEPPGKPETKKEEARPAAETKPGQAPPAAAKEAPKPAIAPSPQPKAPAAGNAPPEDKPPAAGETKPAEPPKTGK